MIQKTSSRQAAIRSLGVLVLCATLFSFSEKIGVDSFTIYLNDKLLIRQYVTPEERVKTVALNVSSSNDVLKVHYNHCGKIGTKRSMAIRDGKKKTLKTWYFSDNTPPVMDLGVKEVLVHRKDAGHQGLQLVYSCREIPEGMVLASIIISDESKASSR